MELAKLILNYAMVLVWPVTLLTIILWFRAPLGRVVERVLSRSEHIELEVGGQRLSIVLAKDAVREAIETAVSESGVEQDPKKLDEIAASTSELLSVLARLSDSDVEALIILVERPGATDKVIRRETVDHLEALGLLTREGHNLGISALGARVKALIAGRDIGETLHKISHAIPDCGSTAICRL